MRCPTSRPLSAGWHAEHMRRQRPILPSRLKLHSLKPHHGAPARRHGGQRRIKYVPPPRSRPIPSAPGEDLMSSAARRRRHAYGPSHRGLEPSSVTEERPGRSQRPGPARPANAGGPAPFWSLEEIFLDSWQKFDLQGYFCVGWGV